MRFKTEKLDWSRHPLWSGLIRRILRTVFVSYRPELHYMRGPGPKWRKKHTRDDLKKWSGGKTSTCSRDVSPPWCREVSKFVRRPTNEAPAAAAMSKWMLERFSRI